MVAGDQELTADNFHIPLIFRKEEKKQIEEAALIAGCCLELNIGVNYSINFSILLAPFLFL